MTKDVKKRILVAAAVVGSFAVLAGGMYVTWLITPPSLPKTADEAASVIGSPRFNRMDDSRKDAYMEASRKLMEQLPPEKRHELFMKNRDNENTHQAMRQMMEREMAKRVDAFTKAATPEEKIKILDEDIDRMEAMRAAFEKMRPPGDNAGGPPQGNANAQGGERRGGGGPGRGGFNPGRMKAHIENRIETGNPQRGALMGEYFQAIRERRKERGLPEMGPPGRGPRR